VPALDGEAVSLLANDGAESGLLTPLTGGTTALAGGADETAPEGLAVLPFLAKGGDVREAVMATRLVSRIPGSPTAEASITEKGSLLFWDSIRIIACGGSSFLPPTTSAVCISNNTQPLSSRFFREKPRSDDFSSTRNSYSGN
jgi:hypothetical protein